MAFSHTYDTVTPDGSADSPSEADDRMQEIKKAVQERLAVEHVFALTGTEVSGANTGKHTDITTTSIVNAGALANTGNLTINTDKFTIDAATGNVVVAGTLGVAGAAEITGIATLGDASLLKTSAAPTTDAMIANKKYVDDLIAAEVIARSFGSWTNKDSLNATLAINGVYKAGTDGTVSCYVAAYTVANGLTDGSSPPTTTRTAGGSAVNIKGGLSLKVRKDDYWKITRSYGSGAVAIYWLPIGTGSCVKQ